MSRIKRRNPVSRLIAQASVIAMLMTVLPVMTAPAALAANPSSGTITAPAGSGTVAVTWTGGPFTRATVDPFLCADGATCDYFEVTIDAPGDYWSSHEGDVTFTIEWDDAGDDFDMYIYRADGSLLDDSASGGTKQESLTFDKLDPGTYTVEVIPWLTTEASYAGSVTLEATQVPPSMVFPETRDDIMDLLTVDYPLNVIFVGYEPTPEEVAEIREWIPEQYQPTVASKSPSGDEIHNDAAGLLNWNKNHLINSDPYFLGIRFNYDIRILQASEEYARALFQVAEDNTAQDYAYQSRTDTEDLTRYNNAYGHFRVQAKGGDVTYAVADTTTIDLIDAYAVEDWIFESRTDPAFSCAFTDLETGACVSAAVIQPQTDAYHDPFYDRFGLNLDHMPQGVNRGSSFFFLDTFGPDYAADYFRPNKYHNYGTDDVIDGQIIPAPVEEGGSWRITDPDTGDWDGVDYGRTWGGRYRFHFVDLGAAPNNFESASWLRAERQLSSDYPHGDPPVWQYEADPQWQQTTDECVTDPGLDEYTGGTPCRIMPRLGRDVAYGLFFRSTAGYLYRPIPRGDVYWLAVSTWTDFYSRPQWVGGQLTSAPWYGTWWTNTDLLYKINEVGNNDDDVLRWLSSATPYARWVGRKGQVIPLYDPTNNQPTGGVLDTSPKYEDLPAPQWKFQSALFGFELAPEPLYPGEENHVYAQYGDAVVDLTEVSNQIELAKAKGAFGFAQDGAVSHTHMRDFVDAHREGIADAVEGVNTIPSINLVFEKFYTWALPAIVGGIAVSTDDGEAWGVMNNVNDRFKWDQANYPPVQPGDEPGSKRSMAVPAPPTQANGTGFSYTIEHEAAHNLGLSHPHDGSYGVDKCTDGPNAGEWQCYWSGLGWMYDISAAPTTYAMAYRPYEVEDQDNLQRGHVAEYLVAAQNALRDRLVAEAQSGANEPSADWQTDYATMQTWRTQAADLFACGDYLHAEYAARNASLVARGFDQTAANTVEPKLLEAGQIFFFNVNPQGGCEGDGGGGGGGGTPVGGGKVTGGGWLSSTNGAKINFGFNAKTRDEGPQGHLNLNDRAAGVKIKLDTVTAIGGLTAACASIEPGPNAIEFQGTGTLNGSEASFRVCAEDNGEGSNAGAPDAFAVFCLDGCDYSTDARTSDDLVDGGNIQLHEAPAAAGSESGGATAPAPGAADGGGATVLILDPVLLTEGIAGTLQTLEVKAFDASGNPATGAITLEATTATGAAGSLTALTNAAGVASFVVTVASGDVEYVARVGTLQSNTVSLSGIIGLD